MRKKLTVVDVLMVVLVVFSIIVASPYVVRQFMELTKAGDIIWNASLDVVILTLFLLIVYAIDKLMNRFL